MQDEVKKYRIKNNMYSVLMGFDGCTHTQAASGEVGGCRVCTHERNRAGRDVTLVL